MRTWDGVCEARTEEKKAKRSCVVGGECFFGVDSWVIGIWTRSKLRRREWIENGRALAWAGQGCDVSTKILSVTVG